MQLSRASTGKDIAIFRGWDAALGWPISPCSLWAGGATGGAAGTSAGGTAGSSAGGTAGTSTGGTANSGGGGTAAVAGTGGSAGAASCGTPADVCADACLAKINALADTAVKECLADPTCTCDLGCYVSSYCKSAGGCSPNTKRDVAIDAICSAAIAECSYIFCNP